MAGYIIRTSDSIVSYLHSQIISIVIIWSCPLSMQSSKTTIINWCFATNSEMESFTTIPWGFFQSQNPIAVTSAKTYNVLVSQTITIQLLGPLSAVASHLLSSLTHVAEMLLFCKRYVIFCSSFWTTTMTQSMLSSEKNIIRHCPEYLTTTHHWSYYHWQSLVVRLIFCFHFA